MLERQCRSIRAAVCVQSEKVGNFFVRGNSVRYGRFRGRIDAIDRATGELAAVYSTTAEHGGVLHVACGNRRETVCPACSQV